ncbi:MAG: tRNA pseudouridine(55) synthase TruB [Bacilli bacterium]|nr:tRNA pseudouridine(55) synthase TruB [Bacilli bacterium]MDD4808978.1 tRNA pseudouridine(55) synthase TruB [Bacilli bacterium]
MNGIVIINKEKDYTSRDVVNIISKKYNTKKVGHAGTLDPMATGVLVVCIGNSTKLVELLTNHDKEYIAEITLGTLTDTLDATGIILKEEDINVNQQQIEDVLTSMIGKYMQEVPIYSAVKIKGKKLYEYARNDEFIELPKREVEIKKLELISNVDYINQKTIFKIKCLVSKGTYIRALVNDIASKLGTVGMMSALERTKQGAFDIKDAHKINDDLNLLEPRQVLTQYKQVKVDSSLENDILNGKVIDHLYDEDIVVFLNNNDEVIAIYQISDKDQTKIKPWKMLITK